MINTVLHWISQDVSAGLIRGGNFAGIIIAQLKAVERHGLPQIPSGVDENLMASLGVDDNYSLLEFMTRVS